MIATVLCIIVSVAEYTRDFEGLSNFPDEAR